MNFYTDYSTIQVIYSFLIMKSIFKSGGLEGDYERDECFMSLRDVAMLLFKADYSSERVITLDHIGQRWLK